MEIVFCHFPDHYHLMKDPALTAIESGLTYTSDKSPGIRRLKRGRGFSYVDETTQKKVSSELHLKRIKDLVIPPAWRDVWICKSPRGHLQVTGFDKRGRKQYRYHPKWNEKRNESKFDQLIDLGKSIPHIRKKVQRDLSLPGLGREKVVAAVIETLLLTQARIGNHIYAEENDSFGLTTILNEHAEVHGNSVHLEFRGKSGIEHDITFSHPKISRILLRCQELPGEELFCYLNEAGESVDINSSHINAYLKDATGEDFTAKDLRTWGGTCQALKLLMEMEDPVNLRPTYLKKREVTVIKKTAEFLRNTVSVCRKYYIHPLIFAADKSGVLKLLWSECRECKYTKREEKLLLRLLEETNALKAVAA